VIIQRPHVAAEDVLYACTEWNAISVSIAAETIEPPVQVIGGSDKGARVRAVNDVTSRTSCPTSGTDHQAQQEQQMVVPSRMWKNPDSTKRQAPDASAGPA